MPTPVSNSLEAFHDVSSYVSSSSVILYDVIDEDPLAWNFAAVHQDIAVSADGMTIEVMLGAEEGWKGAKTLPRSLTEPFYVEFTIQEALSAEVLVGIGPSTAAITSDFSKIYKGTTFSTLPTLNASTVYVSSAEGWEESGAALVIDSTNDFDYFAWMQRLANSLKTRPGEGSVPASDPMLIQAHSVNARVYPIDVDITLNGSVHEYTLAPFNSTYFAYSSAGHLYSPITVEAATGTNVYSVPELFEVGWGESFRSGDVIGLAVDPVRGYGWFAKNNTWQKAGSPSTFTNSSFQGLDTSSGYSFFASMRFPGNKIKINTGDSAFTYAPPSGYVGLISGLTSYYIEGHVAKLGSYVQRTVALIDREWRTVVATTESDPITGVYRFDNVRGDRVYTLLALPLSYEQNVNALVLDHIVPTHY